MSIYPPHPRAQPSPSLATDLPLPQLTVITAGEGVLQQVSYLPWIIICSFQCDTVLIGHDNIPLIYKPGGKIATNVQR